MVLTQGQEKGLKIAVERYKRKEAYTVIAGYAGVGKTYLVKHIVEALNIKPQDVCYISYTGKASLVLREKGCENSMTAHRLLYYSKELPDGTFEHKPRERLEYPYKLIVVDEVSMIPIDIWDLLLSHRVHVIALGDPFQIPPINGESDVLLHPHVFLDEIVRQAQESEIIRLSMDVRAGLPLVKHKGNEVSVISKHQLNDAYYAGADQIIAAKNITRTNINWKCRKIKFGPDVSNHPIDGEKVICLKNFWNVLSSQGDPAINGMIGELKNIEYSHNVPKFNDIMLSDFVIGDNNKFSGLFMDYRIFIDGKQTINSDNWMDFRGEQKPMLFDYGYCITGHRSQGSEWNKVLVFAEYMKGTDFQRWLYTAITRAKQKLIIVNEY
ncbi:MAG: AAA family ATPase [Erysipelotrichaceae bacterium]|nr:AAA family ATPase [Erysipelotrichaceae bacterium]